MDKIADILKIFIEKHLMPTIISIAMAITTLLLIREDNASLLRIGNVSFIILSFCVYFISILLIIKIVHYIRSGIYEVKYNVKQNKKKYQEVIEIINEFVDRLSLQDKEILLRFVENGNKILITNQRYGAYDSLLENNKVMNYSNYNGSIFSIDKNKYWLAPNLQQMLINGMHPIGGLMQYKIKDNIFHDLDLIYKSIGKLGNF